MLSRVANTMYWMNRYIERAENYARFMDVNFNLSLESPPDAEQQWKPLVVITG
ncbi:MAG: alpha-E domain-containing protein, partial [Flavobacteriaceae bacterium]